MIGARWRRISELVQGAIDSPAADRAAYLSAACGADSELRLEVESLLSAHGRAADFLEREVSRSAFPTHGPTAHVTVSAYDVATPRGGGLHLPVGTLINSRYRIEAVVGEGGMGVVYRAVDLTRPEVAMALKTIRARSLDPMQLGMFKAEFRTMAKLHHPNVAAVYDFEAIHGSADHLFTMQYVHGRELWSATLTLDWKEILGLLVQVCRALAYVHSRRIIHFDVKPANILVDAEGRIRVLDFGIAGARPHGAIGTPAYMAPELTSPAAHVDHRADLYALGITAYALFCRRLPFRATSVSELIRQHQLEPLTFDAEDQRELPEWLQQVVKRLCAKQPADRYRTANAALEAINRAGGLTYDLETKETRESYLLSSRFVGRDAEFETLSNFVTARLHAVVDVPPALFVSGQSGLGKSRLMREFRHHAQVSRINFVEGNCYEGALSEYGPMVEILRPLVRLAEAVGAHALTDRFGPSLATLDTELAPAHRPAATAGSTEADRLRLLEQLSAFFLALCERTPYVLYLNDLQWATSGTTELLAYVMRRVALDQQQGRAHRLALLASFRDDEVSGTPLADLLQSASERGALRILPLQPLNTSDVGRLLGSMLGLDELPEEFVTRVVRETGGNPFFLEEVMRALVESHSVFLEAGSWSTNRTIGELAIPASMPHVFRRRAAAVSLSERGLLDVMAVCGRPMSATLLSDVAETTVVAVHDVHEALTGLMQRQMVVRTADGLYRLSHDRMRETLSADMAPTDSARLHGALATALEAHRGTASLGELAQHYWHAGNRAKALHYSLLGGNSAADRYATDEAIELLDHAMELTDAGRDLALRAQVNERLADLYTLRGNYGESLNRYQRLSDAAASAEEKARLWYRMGLVSFQQGKLNEAARQLFVALRLLGDPVPRSKLGYGLGTLAQLAIHLVHRVTPWSVHQVTDERTMARSKLLLQIYLKIGFFNYYLDHTLLPYWSFRTCNASDRLPDTQAAAETYSSIGAFYAALGFKRSATTYLRRGKEVATRLGVEFGLAHSTLYTAICQYYWAEWEAAIANGKDAIERFSRCGSMWELATAYSHLALALHRQGRLREMYAYCREGLAIMERTNSMMVGKGLLAFTSSCRVLFGDAETALCDSERAQRLGEQTNDVTLLPHLISVVGESLLALGRSDEAIERLDVGRRLIEKYRLPHDYGAGTYALLVRAYLQKYAPGTLPGTVQREVRRLVRRGMRFVRSDPNHQVAMIIAAADFEAHLDRRVNARQLFDKALMLATRQGATLELALGQFAYGRFLARCGADDRAAAAHLLTSAQTSLETMGVQLFAPEIRTLLGCLAEKSPAN